MRGLDQLLCTPHGQTAAILRFNAYSVLKPFTGAISGYELRSLGNARASCSCPKASKIDAEVRSCVYRGYHVEDFPW